MSEGPRSGRRMGYCSGRRVKPMKIAISISGDNLDAPFDARFGRAGAFCLADTSNDEWSVHENPALAATGGAGVLAAQFVAGLGVGSVVSGAFGPNAFNTLKAAGVAMYAGPTDRTVAAREVVEMFSAGSLTRVTAASAEGHHGGRGSGRS